MAAIRNILVAVKDAASKVKPAEIKIRVMPRRRGMHFVGPPGMGTGF